MQIGKTRTEKHIRPRPLLRTPGDSISFECLPHSQLTVGERCLACLRTGIHRLLEGRRSLTHREMEVQIVVDVPEYVRGSLRRYLRPRYLAFTGSSACLGNMGIASISCIPRNKFTCSISGARRSAAASMDN